MGLTMPAITVEFSTSDELDAFKKAVTKYGERVGKFPLDDDADLYSRLSAIARNTCPSCLKSDRLERRNYDMMWGEADLFCGRCDVKVRDMDFG